MAICSALAGVMAKLVFTYDWTWFVALMFGSIISATDPVAVVALLNELRMLLVYFRASKLNAGPQHSRIVHRC